MRANHRDLRSIFLAITAVTATAACGGSTDGSASGVDGGQGPREAGGGNAPLCQAAEHPYKVERAPYDQSLCEVQGSGLDAGDGGDGGDGADAGPIKVVCACERLCPKLPDDYWYQTVVCVVPGEPPVRDDVECRYTPKPCGRAHEGMPPASARSPSIGDWLAGAAYLEAASVTSFEILSTELEVLGAPRELIAEALRSAEDERRHARAMEALAMRHGASVEHAPVPKREPRALFAVLLENAVEGQVRETYGALLAWHQSQHATDDALRGAMLRIAEDETRHAELAWKIAQWGEGHLSSAERSMLTDARRAAATDLTRDLDNEPDHRLVDAIGLPRPRRAQAMLAALVSELGVG